MLEKSQDEVIKLRAKPAKMSNQIGYLTKLLERSVDERDLAQAHHAKMKKQIAYLVDLLGK